MTAFEGLPPLASELNQLKTIVSDTTKRADQAAALANTDPIIVLELLRTANGMAYSEGKPPVTTAKQAIVRLGADGSVDAVESMAGGSSYSEKTAQAFETARTRCVLLAKIAEKMSSTLLKNFVEDTFTAGIFLNIGELVTINKLQDKYVEIVEANSRTKLLYRLEKDHKINLERVAVEHLKKAGVPDLILFAIDSSMTAPQPARALMKPICASSEEFLTFYEGNRWEKIKPGETLPVKSTLRMLPITEAQYKTVYEGVGQLLHEHFNKSA